MSACVSAESIYLLGFFLKHLEEDTNPDDPDDPEKPIYYPATKKKEKKRKKTKERGASQKEERCTHKRGHELMKRPTG